MPKNTKEAEFEPMVYGFVQGMDMAQESSADKVSRLKSQVKDLQTQLKDVKEEIKKQSIANSLMKSSTRLAQHPDNFFMQRAQEINRAELDGIKEKITTLNNEISELESTAPKPVSP